MKVEDRRIVAKVTERLLKHYHVSRMTFARKIDDLERKPGERWVPCAQRLLGLMRRWTSDCKSVEEACESFVMDRLMKIMPKQIAIKVKEKKPDALETAAEWADDIWESLEWKYDVPSKDK